MNNHSFARERADERGSLTNQIITVHVLAINCSTMRVTHRY